LAYLTIDHPDGARLALTVSVPAGDPRSVVVLLPTMEVPARYYDRFAAELGRFGHVVAILDFRGQGESHPRASRSTRFGYSELVDVDMPAAVDRLRAEYPGTPVLVLGHSLGGHIALRYAGRAAPGTVAGVVLVASGSVWYRCFGLRGVFTLVGSRLVAVTSAVLGYWPGDRVKFAGRQSGDLMREWAAQVQTGDMTGAGGRPEASFPWSGRVLVVDVANDWLAPERSVDHLVRALPLASVQRWRFRSSAPGPVDHFRWARHGEMLAARIDEWISEGVAR